jgi:hypothetical protein
VRSMSRGTARDLITPESERMKVDSGHGQSNPRSPTGVSATLRGSTRAHGSWTPEGHEKRASVRGC